MSTSPSEAGGLSLRGRLLVLLLAVTGLVWSLAALWSYGDARHEIGEMLDAQLAQSAQLLLAQAGHEIDDVPVSELPATHKYERNVAFQIWEHDGGRLLVRSAGAPAAPLSDRVDGFADRLVGGLAWRVYSRLDRERGLMVQVGERHELRDELATQSAFHLLHPLLFSLPVLGLLIWFGVGRGLLPLDRLARDVGTRSPDHPAPLDPGPTPKEVRPLVAALNALFSRVRALVDRERRFTADAAHELRTPLAAIKTQAQVAQGARNVAERDRALAQVVAGVDRATRLVEQLLTLARLDPQERLPASAEVDLAAAATAAVHELAGVASAKRIAVVLDAPRAVTVHGDATMLEVLVRNLLDNALRYTPDGGAVAVRVAADDRGAVVAVVDNGPGIATTERGRVFERFYRVTGTGEAGSGLGLSIVRRIVDLHGAVVELGDGPGQRGLTVEVRFPR